jgi:diguanylate cyclase (GGDEF)-like protein
MLKDAEDRAAENKSSERRRGAKDRRIPVLPWHPDDDQEPINHVPVGVSCIDYSAPLRFFKSLQAAGIADVASHLRANPALFMPAYRKMRLITANRSLLRMYSVADLDQLQTNFHDTMKADSGTAQLHASLAFWEGEPSTARTALRIRPDGSRMYVRTKAMVMAGYEDNWRRVMVSVEDVSVYEESRQRLAESERYAQALFRLAPASLWVEDFSEVKTILDAIRAQGVSDLEAYLPAHPAVLKRCLDAIRIIDFNDQTLKLYHAPSKDALRERLASLKGDGIGGVLLENLTDFWHGRLQFTREVHNLDMNGNPLDLVFHVSVMPGHEHDWSLVLIAKTDFTERKAIERQLDHISRHDGLTGLNNRFCFNQLVEQIRGRGPFPISVICADLNGLKPVNDRLGHEAGDALLCRAAGVLRQAAGEAGVAVRMGGDEFLVLLPGAPLVAAEALMADITALVNAQKGADGPLLTLSLGCAACEDAAGIDEMLRAADLAMYEAKRAHYAKVMA